MIPRPSGTWEGWANQLIQILNPFMTRVESQFFRQGQTLKLRSVTVANLPSAATPGCAVYVSDESGGAVVAVSDGTNWRRVTDRAVVS